MKFERRVSLDFTGGPVVKNLPDNAGDMSSVPGLGRFHMPTGQLSSCTTATESVQVLRAREGLQLLSLGTLEPKLCGKRSHCIENSIHC